MNPNPNDPLVEPLTEREEDVLALLIEGRTNREIAETLFLSLNTVKWHNRQIYGKLGVENREEAVERARELGLVDDEESAKRDYALHLPRFTTTFIGRESELAQLKSLIQDPEHRLITLLAPGGMGKTRLAVAAASTQAENFTDGIYFVPFSPISDVGHLSSQVAETLNVDFYLREQSVRWKSDEQYDQIISYLAQKKMLLIFDNVEQLLVQEGAKYAGISLTDFVNRLLQDAPDVTMLITSRERLNLKTETVVPILGLQLPPLHKITAVALTEYEAKSDAIQLFSHCVQRIQPDFAITPHNVQDIIDICQLVGGMPLAIELATAWQEMLSIPAIKAEIANSIDFLETTLRDIPERHRTIRSVFEATWQRLNDDERKAFSQLAIFCGGFRRRAAQTICNVSLKTLMELIHKGLLTVDETGRYQIHELLRQYGEEKLAQSHALYVTIRQKHCLYYADFLHEQEPALYGDQQSLALKQIEPEIPNARVAWGWAIANKQYDALEKAMESLCEYHRRRGQLDEGYKFFYPTAQKLGWHGWLATYDNPSSSMVLEETLQLFDVGVQASPSTLDRQTVLGKTLARYSRFYCESPDLERAVLQLRQDTLKALSQSGNGREMAWVLRYLGHAGQRPSHTEQLYQIALASFEAQNDQRGIAETHYRLGVNAIDQGKYERAIPFLENGVALCQAINNHAVEAAGIIRLGEAYWALGQNETAERICNEALTIIKEISYPALQADVYLVLARIAISRSDLNLATTHLNRSQAIFEELGLKGLLANTKARLAHVAAIGGKTTAAKELAQESIELCLKRDYLAGCCEAHMALGMIMSEPAIVLSHLVNAMNIAQTSGLLSYHLHALGYTVSALDSLHEDNIAQQAITIISQHESSWHWTKQWLKEKNLLSHSVPTSLELKEITLQIQSIASSTVNL